MSSPAAEAPKRTAQISAGIRGLIGAVVAGGSIIGGYGWYRSVARENAVRGLGDADIGGSFALTDVDGRRVSSDDLKGRYLLLYFGFTHCPDICPTELTIMSEVTRRLTDAKREWGDLIQPVFVSIDPSRDTPTLIKAYLRDFSPRILGLTGTADEVAAAAKRYKVFFYSLRDGASDEYLIDHSIFIYLVGPDGKYIAHYGYDKTAKAVFDDVSSKLPTRWYEFWL